MKKNCAFFQFQGEMTLYIRLTVDYWPDIPQSVKKRGKTKFEPIHFFQTARRAEGGDYGPDEQKADFCWPKSPTYLSTLLADPLCRHQESRSLNTQETRSTTLKYPYLYKQSTGREREREIYTINWGKRECERNSLESRAKKWYQPNQMYKKVSKWHNYQTDGDIM